MQSKKYLSAGVGLVALASALVAVPALAETSTTAGQSDQSTPRASIMGQIHGRGIPMMGRGVVGTVSAVSGNTITINGRQGFGSTTATVVFTVDATNAKVTKTNVASTVSAIAVGDTVIVQGAVTGTNVVATTIRDGVPSKVGGKKGGALGSTTQPVIGNGQPIVAGTISAITGSALTITNKSNVTYSVDATNAKVLQGNATVAFTTLKVGDAVVAQGAVNGTAVVASTIIDQTVSGAAAGSGTTPAPHASVFGKIGGFFMHLFGF